MIKHYSKKYFNIYTLVSFPDTPNEIKIALQKIFNCLPTKNQIN